MHFQEDVIGVDPTVFRRYFRDEQEEIDEELADCADRRCEVKDYKMPRRRTTRRKKRSNRDSNSESDKWVVKNCPVQGWNLPTLKLYHLSPWPWQIKKIKNLLGDRYKLLHCLLLEKIWNFQNCLKFKLFPLWMPKVGRSSEFLTHFWYFPF